MVGQLVGSYRIIRQIGEGGMGVVYEGMRDDIGSRAAIKVLRPEFAMKTEIAARFFNEAKAANLIEHPGIVKIFDYGQLPSGAAFLAMEYLSGESLHQRITREKRLSENDTIRIGRQVAMALSAAHAKKVIHRDLKPENIILVPDIEAPSGERAKILDFGIAKLAREHTGAVTTDTSVVMGTPIYMSPEQCKGGKTVGDRADVYALGVMLFELLSGRTPFVAEEPGEYIGMHLFKDPPAIASLVPNLLPKLRMLVDSMLLKDASKRPTMAAVAMILRDLSNVSTDVKSMADLLAESKLDGETQPLLNPAVIAKTEAALARPESVSKQPVQLAKPIPAIPIPIALKQPAVALAPLRKTVDPLADTIPDTTKPQQSESVERTLADAEPAGAARALIAPTAAALAGSIAGAPTRSLSSEAVTVKAIKARPPAQGAAAHPVAPAVKPAAVVKPPAIAEAVTQRPAIAEAITQRPAAFTPAWQQVQIVAAPHDALEKLDGHNASAGVDSDDRAKRRRPLGKQLRRLRFRIKRRMLGWFGIPLADQRITPTRTTAPGQRTPLFVAALVLCVGLAGILLWRRSGNSQATPAQKAAATDRATQGTESSPPTPASAQPPAPPMAPPATTAEVLPALPPEVASRLNALKEKEDAGKLTAAFREARSASKKLDHPALWNAMGRYACQLANAKGANEALSHLSPETAANGHERQKLIATCAQQGLSRNESGLFELRN